MGDCATAGFLPDGDMVWDLGVADAEGDRQLARMELEPGPTAERPTDPEAGWTLRAIRMTVDGSGQPLRWGDGSLRTSDGKITVTARLGNTARSCRRREGVYNAATTTATSPHRPGPWCEEETA